MTRFFWEVGLDFVNYERLNSQLSYRQCKRRQNNLVFMLPERGTALSYYALRS